MERRLDEHARMVSPRTQFSPREGAHLDQLNAKDHQGSSEGIREPDPHPNRGGLLDELQEHNAVNMEWDNSSADPYTIKRGQTRVLEFEQVQEPIQLDIASLQGGTGESQMTYLIQLHTTPYNPQRFMNLDPGASSSLSGTTSEIRPPMTNPNILMWNCRRAGRQAFLTDFTELTRTSKPTIAIILDTRHTEMDSIPIIASLGYDSRLIVPSRGYAGGLWMLWNKHDASIIAQASTPHAIHVIISLAIEPKPWMMSAIYASPRRAERESTWQEVSHLGEQAQFPYMAI